jgi:predicted nucleotidyltransferase
MPTIDLNELVTILRGRFPSVWAAYLFGSAADGSMREDSDIDLALLSDTPLDPVAVFGLKSDLSRRFRRDVDVVDLARTDTVTASQVVHLGVVIFQTDAARLAHYETFVFSSYALLNEERAEILADIQRTGTIHG